MKIMKASKIELPGTPKFQKQTTNPILVYQFNGLVTTIPCHIFRFMIYSQNRKYAYYKSILKKHGDEAFEQARIHPDFS